MKDDIAEIMDKVKEAEVIVYASQIYYYEMCGQMKTLLDRLNPLYSSDYAFRDICMIATAAEDEESAFEKAELKGIVTGAGIADANDALNYNDVMKKAYDLGRSLQCFDNCLAIMPGFLFFENLILTLNVVFMYILLRTNRTEIDRLDIGQGYTDGRVKCRRLVEEARIVFREYGRVFTLID